MLLTTGVRTEANLPFAGLHQLLRPILTGLDALPKPQYTALGVAFGLVEGAAEDPFLIALATLTLLADAAARTPILVVADDVQWLDRPSADALAFVARRLGSDPLVMLVGLRDGEASPLDSAGIAELALQRLNDRDAREMVSRIAPGLAPPVRDRILQEAAGNPLALAELSATLRDDNASGEGRPSILPLSARLEREFVARAEDLPHDTQWLLLIAALDDRDGVSEIVAAAGVPASAMKPAVDARLIEVDGQSLRFRHPLIRSAIQQRATMEDQRVAHDALAGVVGDLDRAAWHRAAATDAPDESAAALLDAAAERAIHRGALTVAVAALQRAATLSADGRGRGTRLLRAADVANEIGSIDVVGQTLAEAGADRRTGARGQPPGLDHGALARRSAISPREGRPPIRGRRRAAIGRERPGGSWSDASPLRDLPELVDRPRRRDPVRDSGCIACPRPGPGRRRADPTERHRPGGPHRRPPDPPRQALGIAGARERRRRAAPRNGGPLGGRA